MSLSRRDALAQLSALFAVPFAARGAWWPAAERSAPADDPLDGTIALYQAGRLRGEYSAVEVTTLALARCRTLGAQLRAIDLLAETALAEARASDDRLRRRALRGPLDGVPLFAKSIYDMRGLATTASSAEWVRLFPTAVARDAIEVERLRAAGAVLLGKTAADDFAYRGNGTASATGQVRNPHDAAGRITPGGSSAGSAVAVACGMAFCALGTDDGGSNRIPAQFTGVVGVKPTFGLVPRTGVIPTWPVLDTHGPLARTVADAALMLDVLAGHEGGDGLSLRARWQRGTLGTLDANALRGARLGVVEVHAPRAQMTAECLAVFDNALADCAKAGGIVEAFVPAVDRTNYREQFAAAATARGDVPPNANAPGATANALRRYFERQGVNATIAMQRGLAAYRAFYDVLPTEWSDLAPLTKVPYERDAASVSFLASRETVVAALARSMAGRRIDAMVYPTMPFKAPEATSPWPDVRTPLGYGNWLGLPEISVPAGYGADGLPAGNLSFVGLPGSDAKLFALAHAYEQASRRFRMPTVG
jgi:Asp-tRNA(Asn)/Glu-tRNA(Gln) amidotransferase A subunit family amidase